MAKEKLNPKKLTELKPKAGPDGKMIDVEHSDGGGLYLVATATGNHRWIFKFQWPDADGVKKGKRMGLGSLDHVTIEEARELAREADKKVKRDGINPMVDRPGETNDRVTSPTFKAFAEYIRRVATAHLTEKSVARWDLGMNVYAKPLHNLRIATIARQDVVDCLEPIWQTIPAGAKKFQGQLYDLFDRAVAAGKFPEASRNPADWNLLKKLLERQTHEETSHRWLPYKQMPAVWPRLVELDSVAAWTAQFIILTGVRTNEAMQLTRDQIDFDHEDGPIWRIPKKIMKNKMAANVPLSRQAVAVVRKALNWQASLHLKTTLVFPGRDGNMQGQNSALAVFQLQLKLDTTTHGCRTSFRSWGGDQKGIDRATLEHCLHHLVGDEAELVYNKAEQWEKRQEVLQLWADYVTDKHVAPAKSRPDLKVVAA